MKKRILAIAGVILLAIAIVLAVVFGVANNKPAAETRSNFYIVINGERYYDDCAIKLNKNSITVFRFSDTVSGEQTRKIRITSRATAQTVFTYTIEGAKRMFLDGEDYTQYFDITESTDGFELTHNEDTPATILQRRFAGRNVVVPETDPEISYFTLTVSSSDGSQSIDFALTFNGVIEEKEPPSIIV